MLLLVRSSAVIFLVVKCLDLVNIFTSHVKKKVFISHVKLDLTRRTKRSEMSCRLIIMFLLPLLEYLHQSRQVIALVFGNYIFFFYWISQVDDFQYKCQEIKINKKYQSCQEKVFFISHVHLRVFISHLKRSVFLFVTSTKEVLLFLYSSVFIIHANQSIFISHVN